MIKLCKHLEENKLFHFWVEAGGKFSNKIHGNKDNFEKLIKKNPSKFINKTFCYFQGCCHFDNPHSLWYSKGVLINYRLTPFHVNEKSELKDSGRTLSILWKKEDL